MGRANDGMSAGGVFAVCLLLAMVCGFCTGMPGVMADAPPDTAYVGQVVDEAGGHPVEVMVQHVMIPDDSAMLATGMRHLGGAYVGQYLSEDTMRIYDGGPNYTRVLPTVDRWLHFTVYDYDTNPDGDSVGVDSLHVRPVGWKWVIITTGDLNGDGSVDISDLVYMIDFMFLGGGQ